MKRFNISTFDQFYALVFVISTTTVVILLLLLFKFKCRDECMSTPTKICIKIIKEKHTFLMVWILNNSLIFQLLKFNNNAYRYACTNTANTSTVWCNMRLWYDKCTHYDPYLYTKHTTFSTCTRLWWQKTIKTEEQ